MSTNQHRDAILKSIDQLPPLHKVVQKLIALMNDDRSSARDLDKLIRNDQAMTARILKLANSSTYGKSREVFQLTEAVVMLGHGAISNLVMSMGVGDVMTARVDEDFAALAWGHSLDCAAVAEAVAQLTGTVDPEKAYVAGLLHDIGLLVQARAVPEILRKVVASRPADPLAAERDAMGLNHAQIGLKLLEMWHLPPALCEAVRLHHAPNRKYGRTNPLINIVALADQLTTIASKSFYPQQADCNIFHLLRDVGLKPDQFEQLFTALNASRDNVRCLLNEVRLPGHEVLPHPDNLALHLPVSVYTADPGRRQWYPSVLYHLGVPVTSWRAITADVTGSLDTKQVIVDFHGVTPEERQILDTLIREHTLTPVVLGDRRHTPRDASWQAAPRATQDATFSVPARRPRS